MQSFHGIQGPNRTIPPISLVDLGSYCGNSSAINVLFDVVSLFCQNLNMHSKQYP